MSIIFISHCKLPKNILAVLLKQLVLRTGFKPVKGVIPG